MTPALQTDRILCTAAVVHRQGLETQGDGHKRVSEGLPSSCMQHVSICAEASAGFRAQVSAFKAERSAAELHVLLAAQGRWCNV